MIRYLLLLPLSIGMTLLAYVLAPVLPLFSVRYIRVIGLDGGMEGCPWLVWWLWWFQTPDNSLYGDEGHEKRWGYKHSYWQMVAWLWRNPAYGFEWNGPLAATIGVSSKVVQYGNPNIKNRDNAVAGWYFCRIGKYWNFKAVIPLFGDLAFMPEFGWKLQGFAQGRETEGKAQYVFSPRLTAFYKE